jgi:hypothetical protein
MDGGEAQQSAAMTGGSARAVRWLTALGLGVAVGLLALGVGVLWDARQDAWRQATRSADNLAVTMEREIRRTFDVYDLSLQGAVDALSQPGIDDISPALRHAAIFDRAASAEYLGSLLVLDAKGDIADDSTAVQPHRLNLADRDYFQLQKQRPDVGLFVSRPFLSRLRNGSPSMSISRRLQDADGRFAGVVVGTLKLDYFTDMFSHLNLGHATAIVLLRTDGHMVVREPPSPDDLDRDLSGSPLQRAVLRTPIGSYLTRSIVDGVDRWITYRQVGELPLVLGIATSVESIYAAWWQKALGIGTILLMLSGAIIVLILLRPTASLASPTAVPSRLT